MILVETFRPVDSHSGTMLTMAWTRSVPTKTARKIGRKYMMAYRPEPAQMCIR